MSISSILLNPETIKKGSIAYGFLNKLFDLLSKKERIKVIFTSPDFKEIDILWGLFHFQKGEKKEFIIEGSKGFCEAVLKNLEQGGGKLENLRREFLK